MYFGVTNSLKKRIVLVFQEIFRQHPIFNKVEVITKFPEKDRPKNALLIRSVSGSSVRISMNNFVRTLRQYSSLANLKGINGNSIEWVRDDLENLDKMSAPGYYVVRMLTNKSFVVEPYLLVSDEELTIQFIEGKEGAYLKNTPVNPNSETIVLESGVYLKKTFDYTIDYATGKILFQTSLDNEKVFVDYQIIGEQSEEYKIDIYQACNDVIPGVIMAFGDRLNEGDEQVVIVEKENRDVAQAFGGRWQLSVDLIGLSQDSDQQERLVDYAVSMFWAKYQEKLIDEGINVFDFSLSGEAEDLESEIPEEYFYTGGISFTAEVDWENHIPLVAEIKRANITYGEESYKQSISNEQELNYENKQFDTRMANSRHQNGLQLIPNENSVVMRPAPPIIVKSLKYPR